LGVTQNFSSLGGSNGGGDDDDERPKLWLILSSEMGKVQSILFVCLFVCQPKKTQKPCLQALLFLFGGI
jgi:hypothetical protein